MQCNEKFHQCQRIAAAVFCLVLAGVAVRAGGIQVEVLTIEGTIERGEWAGADAHSVKLQLEEGHGATEYKLDTLSSLSFSSSEKAGEGAMAFHLADGGRLSGEIIKGGSDRIVARTSLGETPLPFASLAGIRFTKESESEKAAIVFRDALTSRLPGQDVLISRDADEVKSVRGTLEELDAEKGSFRFGERSRVFQVDKIYGIVFASGAGESEHKPLTAHLSNGDTFTGDFRTGDAETVSLTTSFGMAASISLLDIRSIDVHSDRVSFVSDLTPGDEVVEGLVHDPWPVRRDRSASNTPLSIAGRGFSRGLGVHSRTKLSYEIGAKYETFLATVGLDDVVRPRGGVVFQVLGDGRVLFDSGLVRGVDPPREIRVPVEGVKIMTLLVDYGEGLDIAGQADWGGARLLKSETAPPKRRH